MEKQGSMEGGERSETGKKNKAAWREEREARQERRTQQRERREEQSSIDRRKLHYVSVVLMCIKHMCNVDLSIKYRCS